MRGTARSIPALLVLIGCGTGCLADTPAATCETHETALVAELRTEANRLFDGLQVKESLYSGCEDRGAPEPVLYLSVPSWSSLREGGAFLREHSWTPVADRAVPTFRDPGGRYAVSLIWVTDASGRWATAQLMLSAYEGPRPGQRL